MGLPKIYTNTCAFYTDGLIEYTKTKIDSFISTRGSVQRLFSGGNSSYGTAQLEGAINNFKEILITPGTETSYADLYTPICIPFAILVNTQDRRVVYTYQNIYVISVVFSDNSHIIWNQYGTSTIYFQVYGIR